MYVLFRKHTVFVNDVDYAAYQLVVPAKFCARDKTEYSGVCKTCSCLSKFFWPHVKKDV